MCNVSVTGYEAKIAETTVTAETQIIRPRKHLPDIIVGTFVLCCQIYITVNIHQYLDKCMLSKYILILEIYIFPLNLNITEIYEQ